MRSIRNITAGTGRAYAGTPLPGPRACFAGDLWRLSCMLKSVPSFPSYLTPEDPTRTPMIPGLRLPGTRRRYSGLVASLLLHGLVVGVVVVHGDRLVNPSVAPGSSRLAGSSGGGGNRVAYITLPSLPKPAPAPAVRVTVPVPPPRSVQTPVPQPVPSQLAPLVPADTVPEVAESGGANQTADRGTGTAGAGGAQGAGGLGRGGANGTGGGQGGTLRPPEPREIPLPYDKPPKELRGALLKVTFWVRVDGRVERYQVEPEIKDRDYAQKFDEVMRAFRFTPARAPDGRSVAGVATISVTLPGKSSS